jgi:hypothetical protein
MRVHWSVILPGLLLAIAALARPWLEATMARHMAIELPMLFALGWFAAHVSQSRSPLPLPPWNVSGLPAFFAALLITGFWMLPVALDLAVLDTRVGVIKVFSMVTAGAATGASWRRAGLVMQAFFVFNWVWMTLTIGLLYQNAPQQLCSVYLSDQQAAAGSGMVFLSLAVLIGWICHAFYLLSMQDDGAQQKAGRPETAIWRW